MSVLLKISFLYTNHKDQNRKFSWFDKTSAILFSYYFASFMALKTKTKTFISCYLVLFMALKTKIASFHDFTHSMPVLPSYINESIEDNTGI